jgi:hypothetical protein
MVGRKSARRDVALLEMMLGTFPSCTSEEEHRTAVTRLLDFYERLHADLRTEAPAWLRLGIERYSRA